MHKIRPSCGLASIERSITEGERDKLMSKFYLRLINHFIKTHIISHQHLIPFHFISSTPIRFS